jgi:PmbA protein
MGRLTSSFLMRWWVAVAWIEELIREAQKSVDEVELFYIEGTSVSADLKQKKVNLATTSCDCGLGIRTIHKGRIGSSSTNDPAGWRDCLTAAVASGKLATPQAWNGLPEPVSLPSTPLSFDPSLECDPVLARDLLGQMVDGAAEHPAEITAGSASLSVSSVTLANSHGIRYEGHYTGASLSLEAIERQSTGYEFDHACCIADIDPRHVGERATFFACKSADGKDIPTGDYPVVLSPLAYAELLGNVFVPALNGRSVHSGRSRLAKSLGETIADPRIQMYDDPLLPRGSGSTRWDAEGTPTRRTAFVQDGVLRTFAYDLKTAYRYDKKTTGSAVRGGFGGLPAIGHHNFIVDGERENILDERVIYVHSVVGAHTANPMSGDFSVEISNSFWMEDGSFEEPVRSAMMSGNVFDMHKDIAGMSKETRAIGSLILPSIKLNKQRIIGK